MEAFKRGTEVLVATPGRLIDLLDNFADSVSLKTVDVVVLDEVDRYLTDY